jgi:hypothetical protein
MVEGQGDGFPGTGRRFIIGLDSPHRLNRLAECVKAAAGTPKWGKAVGKAWIDQAVAREDAFVGNGIFFSFIIDHREMGGFAA